MTDGNLRGFSLALLFGALLLGGCAAPRSRVAETYGDAVRHMVDAQIYDRAAALDPDPEPVMSLDGRKAEKVLEAHRADVSKPEEVATPITLQIGKQ